MHSNPYANSFWCLCTTRPLSHCGPGVHRVGTTFTCCDCCCTLLLLLLLLSELESQTSHLRARAAKADSNADALAEAQSALAEREQQLQAATEEIERLRNLAQVMHGACGFVEVLSRAEGVGLRAIIDWLLLSCPLGGNQCNAWDVGPAVILVLCFWEAVVCKDLQSAHKLAIRT